MTDHSHIKLGKRVRRNRLFAKGWQPCEKIDAEEVCAVALPGSNVKDSKKANGFAKMIQETLRDKKVAVYCAEYDFAERCFRVDREAVLARFGQENPGLPFIRKVKEEDKTYVPQYIRELYEKTIGVRLRDEAGKAVSLRTASRRLNKMVFVNHCQGTTVALQLEYLMEKDMEKLGYKELERNYLLKQVHNVDVAPVTPIGVTKTTTFKFVSFSDDTATSVYTDKVRYILERKKEHERFLVNIEKKKQNEGEQPFVMNFSLFRPSKTETLFAVNNIYSREFLQDAYFDGIEHAFASYSDRIDDDRTKQGDQLSFTFYAILNWVVDNAKKNENELAELPDIFGEKQFKPLILRAQNNRYEFVTREVKLQKSRRAMNMAVKAGQKKER